MSFNFSSLTPDIIDKWDAKQLCAALIEAKKIEKSVEIIKERLRKILIPGSKTVVSNGVVKISKPGKIFHIVNENIVSETFLLPPIRPLDKKKVLAHFLATEGNLPMGVSVKKSKSSVIVQMK